MAQQRHRQRATAEFGEWLERRRQPVEALPQWQREAVERRDRHVQRLRTNPGYRRRFRVVFEHIARRDGVGVALAQGWPSNHVAELGCEHKIEHARAPPWLVRASIAPAARSARALPRAPTTAQHHPRRATPAFSRSSLADFRNLTELTSRLGRDGGVAMRRPGIGVSHEVEPPHGAASLRARRRARRRDVGARVSVRVTSAIMCARCDAPIFLTVDPGEWCEHAEVLWPSSGGRHERPRKASSATALTYLEALYGGRPDGSLIAIRQKSKGGGRRTSCTARATRCRTSRGRRRLRPRDAAAAAPGEGARRCRARGVAARRVGRHRRQRLARRQRRRRERGRAVARRGAGARARRARADDDRLLGLRRAALLAARPAARVADRRRLRARQRRSSSGGSHACVTRRASSGSTSSTPRTTWRACCARRAASTARATTPVPVTLLDDGGPRYTLEQLRGHGSTIDGAPWRTRTPGR